MASQIHQLEIFADYFQFYVCDGDYQTEISWNDETSDRMLAVWDDLIAIITARNMDVPVTLEILDAEPVPDAERWDQVIDCGVSIPSGTLIVLGCTDYLPDAPQFPVQAGPYRARVSYENLKDLSEDGLEGNDRYRIQVWPGAFAGVDVLKRRP